MVLFGVQTDRQERKRVMSMAKEASISVIADGTVESTLGALTELSYRVLEGEGPVSVWLRKSVEEVKKSPVPQGYRVALDYGRQYSNGPQVELYPIDGGTIHLFGAPEGLPLLIAAALFDSVLRGLGLLIGERVRPNAEKWLESGESHFRTVGYQLEDFANNTKRVVSVSVEDGQVCV